MAETSKAGQRRGARLTAQRRATAAKVKAELAENGRPPARPDPPLLNAADLYMGDDPKKQRKTYQPEYADIAREICQLGGTDIQVARALHISMSVMWSWQARYEDFYKAFLVGKDHADDKVERALFQSAVGYSYPELHIGIFQGQPVVVPYIKHLPPNPNAAGRWLKSRRKEIWADRQEVTLTGDDAFNEMWKAISTGQILPILTGVEPLGDADRDAEGED